MAILWVNVRSEYLYKIEIEEGQEVAIGSGKNDEIMISELMPAQIKCRLKNNQLIVSGKRIADFCDGVIEENPRGTCVSTSLGIAIGWIRNTGKDRKTLKLPLRGVVKIGRSKDNMVVISDDMISRHHMVLRCEEGIIRVEDGYEGALSTNGVYLNGKRIRRALLKSGDIVDLNHIRILMKNSELFFENVEGKLWIDQQLRENLVGSAVATAQRIYRRAPRIREQMPYQDIILAKPPAKGTYLGRNRGGLVSLLSSGAMLGVSVATGMASPALMAARAASLISPAANLAVGHSTNQKEKQKFINYEKQRQEKYGAYIESQKAIIQQIADKQKEISNRENPSPDSCLKTIYELNRSLWERRPNDSDFLRVRLGMGYDDLCVKVKAPLDGGGFQMEYDEIAELTQDIIEETRIVDEIPACVSLSEYSAVGVIGKRQNVIRLVKNMIISLTTAHFYEDVKIVGIFDKGEKGVWETMRWLPHVWDDNQQSRYLAFDKNSAEKLNDIFDDLLRSRKQMEKGAPLPHYVFVFGSRELATSLPLFKELLNSTAMQRVTTLFAYNLGDISAEKQFSYLPQECQFVVNTDDLYECSSAYDVTQINKKFMFQLDKNVENFDWFCRWMSAIVLEEGSVYQELPTSVSFLQGMNATTVKDLDVWERWSQSRGDKTLSTPIAVRGGGKTFYLDVVKQGPHGLVAGTTRSGKSELLASWLLSLAVHYHPYEVSFIIIDFKGGSLADSVEGLPHMVGKITNIGQNIRRARLSLTSELERRQRVFAKYGVKNIGEYMQGYRESRYQEPIPRLLFVTDEFKELRSQEPEFMASLIRTATIGASLGIHLVLATQEPRGIVDDQIRSNTNFQICLKVLDAAASRDVIHHPDAVHITQPGRAYVRVGNDEVFELVQSYWSGAPYTGKKIDTADVGNRVRIVGTGGERIKTFSDEKTRFQSNIEEIQMITRYLTTVAAEHGIVKMPCPWLPELPRRLDFEEIETASGFDGYDWRAGLPWLRIPIGRYDLPEFQSQGTQYLDFEETGHYGIYGAPGTGKDNLLKSIIAALGIWHTPQEVNLYLLDFASGSLKMFENMPHVGGVALADEEEKFAKLLVMFGQIFEKRKDLFSKHGVSSLKSYREIISEDMPAVILAIDNLLPIFECYPEYEKILTKIAAEGANYGIYLVYTANSQNGVKYKIAQNIRGAIAFELSDNSDYSVLVGKVEHYSLIAGIKGRGFMKGQTGPVVFQAVNYAKGDNEKEQRDNIGCLMQQMNQCWKGLRPERIPVMPEKIILDDMKNAFEDYNKIPIGFNYSTIQPEFLNAQSFCGSLIVGTAGSGKSELLCLIGELLNLKDSNNNQLYIIDSSRNGLRQLENVSTRYVMSNDVENTQSMLTRIIEELIIRQKNPKREYVSNVYILIDDIYDFVEHAGDQNWKMLRGIISNGTGLGVVVLAAGRATDVAELSTIDAIVSKIINAQNGLAISGTPAMHSYYLNDMGYEEKNCNIAIGNGIIFDKGSTKKIKLMER